MIKSMTAFAKAEISENFISVMTEIRTLNSRQLDFQIRVPHGYASLEDRIKEYTGRKISRGRVEIRIFITDTSEESSAYEVNLVKAKAYKGALLELVEKLGLSDNIPVNLFSVTQGIITPVEVDVDIDKRWSLIERCLDACIAQLDRMRLIEGDHIKNDFEERLAFIESALDTITEESTGLVERYQKKLVERIKTLTDGIVELDQARILQEAAILADRSDISEEIVRARSHVIQFREIMNSKEPGGRKLNFLLQEFNREFNTMGSKTGHSGVAHLIVDVKSELERLREQVQNVE